MKVKLIGYTKDAINIMYTAARTCYSSKSPIEIFNEGRTTLDFDYNTVDIIKDPGFTEGMIQEDIDKKWKLVKKVLDSGHQSIAEHVYFTFAIEGISRACSHQLVRHRSGIVFSQQSQRYVEIKEDLNDINDYIYEITIMQECEEDVIRYFKQILSKYFVDVDDDNYYGYGLALKHYLQAIKNGAKAEDARNFLPNATKTSITMSVNFRELIHICNLRLCSRAQKEIRDLCTLFKQNIHQVEPLLCTYLVPSCESLGVCMEAHSCGRKPLLKDVINFKL